ncbi:enoyl-CoA hydratase-related protein [Albidovulum sediminis]|uniref:Enoyl-CoA hydratase-related protein n=1 Tax=Albidovulum sediminis TaxID=3066345 RepID=A0ABT2NRK5_9RHOB|nr:enoyl-CoA hydratase-related protein [Defluviimonas sediminis]MCT8330718.1 enoyl-CoA hydratase-related protein [Defluviimonas sediminis]
MTERVIAATSGGIATLLIANPPVNALSREVRADLLAAIEAAEADPAVMAIVLAADGRTWSTGIDLRDHDRPQEAPTLADLCDGVAGCLKPVVAALSGAVLGGGLELALAARARVAAPDTRLGLPEVAFGLSPGGGATQRLPRLVGAGAALTMLLSGQAVTAERAAALGLVDAVADNPLAGALARARDLALGMAPAGRPTPTDGVQEGRAFLAAIDAARSIPRAPEPSAPGRIIDCVEASLLLPAHEGFAYERVVYEELRASAVSAALRHVLRAERRLPIHPDLAGIEIVPRRTVAVAGEGALAADLACDLLGRGLRVTLFDADTEVLTRTIGLVALAYEREEAQGRRTATARREEWTRLDGATEARDLDGIDIILDLSELAGRNARTRMADFGRVAAEGAILATAATGPDLDAAISVSGRPRAVVGLRPAGPASDRLFELAASPITDREILAATLALLRGAGRRVVRTGLTDGSLGERLTGALRFAADRLLEEGATPYAIDAAMMADGWSVGPYAALDRQGLIADLEWRARLETEDEHPLGNAGIGLALLELGRGGISTGAGYYRYDATGVGRPDPDVLAVLVQQRGEAARPLPEATIRARLMAALANEGARLIVEGAARRPSDIDLVMIAGHGLPRWGGGPMQVADRAGLLSVRNQLRTLAQGGDERFWRPAPIWDEMIRIGKRFDDLNGA